MNVNLSPALMAATGLAVIVGGGLFWLVDRPDTQQIEEREAIVNTAPVTSSKPVRTAPFEKQGLAETALMDRMLETETKMDALRDEVGELKESIQMLVERMEGNKAGEEQVETVTLEEYTDELPEEITPEWIAEQDLRQMNYYSEISNQFYAEIPEPGWSDTVETDVLGRLSNMEEFASYSNSSQDGASPLSALPNVSVANFSCKTNLCQTEFWANSMEELVSYQNFMVQKTIDILPSIIFSVPEKVGTKIKMTALLAREEYEFPEPAQIN